MIFVTVGSHPTFRFQRLMDALGAFNPEDLLVQHGPAAPPPGIREAHAWLTFEEMLGCMRRASAIVTHVGVGTIIAASNLGHVPVVVPRLRRYDETVDDHQVELAGVLEQTGHVTVAWDIEQLHELVLRAAPALSRSSPQRRSLQDAVHSALLQT